MASRFSIQAFQLLDHNNFHLGSSGAGPSGDPSAVSWLLTLKYRPDVLDSFLTEVSLEDFLSSTLFDKTPWTLPKNVTASLNHLSLSPLAGFLYMMHWRRGRAQSKAQGDPQNAKPIADRAQTVVRFISAAVLWLGFLLVEIRLVIHFPFFKANLCFLAPLTHDHSYLHPST